MRKITVTAAALLAATMLTLLAVQWAFATTASDAVQVHFGTANGPTDFNYTAPTPPPTNHHFGFWIWCEAPASPNTYSGDCNGAMYFYVLGITRPVKGTVSGSNGVFTMTVSSTDSAISCSLTNATPFSGLAAQRQTINVTCPPEGSGLNPTVQGTGTADDAVVHITGQ